MKWAQKGILKILSQPICWLISRGLLVCRRRVFNLLFLARQSSQTWYAEANSEYPVNPSAEWSEVLQSWGEFKADNSSMSILGDNNAAAVRLMDRAGWR